MFQKLRKRSLLQATAVTAVLGLTMSACGGGSAGESGGGESGDTLNQALSFRASSLDPHGGGTYDVEYTAQIFDSLIKWDSDGQPIPGLATEWEFADDAMQLTLTLREGVQFQDGEALTADAVKKSLEHAMSEDSTRAPDLATVESIETPNEGTVVLNFNSPSAHILSALGTEAGMIISPSVVDGDVATDPVGAGPYRLVSHSPDEIQVEAWDGYWDAESVKTPNLRLRAMVDDTARVRALLSGEIHSTNLRPSHVPEIENGGARVITGPNDLIYYALLNTSTPGLGQPEVRSAISSAINRDAINENLQHGLCVPTAQPFTDAFSGHIDDLEESKSLGYDPESAKSDLGAAGFDASNPLSVEISSSNLTAYQELAEVIQSQLKEIGIESSVSTSDSSQAAAAVRQGNFEIYVGANNVSTPEPTTFVESWYLRDAPWTENYEVPNGVELLEQARTVSEADDDGAALRELVTGLYDQSPPVVPVCAPQAVHGVGEGVEGFEMPAAGAFVLKNVTVPQ